MAVLHRGPPHRHWRGRDLLPAGPRRHEHAARRCPEERAAVGAAMTLLGPVGSVDRLRRHMNPCLVGTTGCIYMCVLALAACSRAPRNEITSKVPYADHIGTKYSVVADDLYALGVYESFENRGPSVVEELSSGGAATANLLTGLKIDETFARADASDTHTILVDALGSVLALTDNAGNILTSYRFEPFGTTSLSGATNTNATQYTSREHDRTDLYYYRARYYSPGIGRFISEDPIGFSGGANLYAYVGDNPVNLIDSLGLC